MIDHGIDILIDSRLRNNHKQFYQNLLQHVRVWDFLCLEGDLSEQSELVNISSKDLILSHEGYIDEDRLYLLYEPENVGFNFFEERPLNDDLTCIVFKNIEELKSLDLIIDKYLQVQKANWEIPLLKKCQRDLKEINTIVKNEMDSLKTTDPEFLNLSEDLLEGYNVLLKTHRLNGEEDLKDILLYLNKKIHSAKFDIADDFQDFDRTYRFSSRDNQNFYIGAKFKKNLKNYTEGEPIILSFILTLNEQFFDSVQMMSFSNVNNAIVSEVFNRIETPVVLFTRDGQLLNYNEAFLDLNTTPNDAFQFKDDETININGIRFHISKQEISNNSGYFTLFVFMNFDNQENDPLKFLNPEELGIVTSSIAHELNNPLAGVLAAITLLKMDDNWNDEQEKAIDEINESARRCKNLVEIFLGFSKAQNLEERNASIRESFNHALALLNFRVIETNTKVSFSWNVSEYFEERIKVNGSIFSMVFYVILGELLTLASHQSLIEESSVETLSGALLDRRDQLVIDVDNQINLALGFKDLEFISFLLRLNNIFIEVNKQQIILKFNEEKSE